MNRPKPEEAMRAALDTTPVDWTRSRALDETRRSGASRTSHETRAVHASAVLICSTRRSDASRDLGESRSSHREPDLSLEGLQTIEGPVLYNFADLPQVILAKVNELSGG